MRVYGFLEEVRFSHPLLLKALESLVFTGFRAFSFFRLKADLQQFQHFHNKKRPLQKDLFFERDLSTILKQQILERIISCSRIFSYFYLNQRRRSSLCPVLSFTTTAPTWNPLPPLIVIISPFCISSDFIHPFCA